MNTLLFLERCSVNLLLQHRRLGMAIFKKTWLIVVCSRNVKFQKMSDDRTCYIANFILQFFASRICFAADGLSAESVLNFKAWEDPLYKIPSDIILSKILLNKQAGKCQKFSAWKSKSSNQGRTSGCAFFLLACIHPVMSCRAGWIFNPSMSLGSFGSSKQAAPCIRARMTHAHLFYNVLYILYMKLWKTNVSFT